MEKEAMGGVMVISGQIQDMNKVSISFASVHRIVPVDGIHKLLTLSGRHLHFM
jgi:hypothetical protein